MLFANLKAFNQQDYARLGEALNFLEQTDVENLPVGRSYPQNKPFYVQTLEYETEDIEKLDFEIHDQRLDLHYVVAGEERIDVSAGNNFVAVTDYNTERDIQYVEQPKAFNQIVLHQGDFILIGMKEPHRTNGIIEQATHVKKIVLKLEG